MPTLEFKGKPFVYSHHLSVPFRELIVEKDKSLSSNDEEPSLDDNLIIHGDNLEALKALLPRYAGKVDVIYIDPPYNTGNEGWAYNDNVNSPLMKEWLGKTVDAEDLERHDKWLCMMWPRLELLRELLSPDGSLWVTLDDNEAQRAKIILDEIFGETCFVSDVTWRSSDNSNNDAKRFSQDKNHILVYSKTASWRPNKLDLPEKRGHFKNPDDDPRGPWFDGNPVDSPSPRENLKFDVLTPSGKLIKPPKNGWRWDKDTLEEKIETGEIRFSEDETRLIRRTYLADMKGLPPSDLWIDLAKYGHNRAAKYQLRQLFGGKDVFSTPKPIKLITSILEVACGPSALVLDSFAGSGATGHGVLEANDKDGGGRKFILVESEAYADALTAERIRRVIGGYKVSRKRNGKLFSESVSGLGGSFTYCELGEPMDMERFFDSEKPPAYEQVARYVAYTAAGQALPKAPKHPAADWFVGETGGQRLHLIYRADPSWMRSNEAMLDMKTAEAIAAATNGKPVLLFAAGKFMGQKQLSELGITFVQLPYAIHRLLSDEDDAA